MTEGRVKYSRVIGEDGERCTKAKRYDIKITTADVDLRLAEKLDSCLKIGGVSKPRFLTNKTREIGTNNSMKADLINEIATQDKLKPRNLTKDELKLRLVKKYDSLVPELDPNRQNVTVVKILSTSGCVELGKDQARKQLERQMALNSVSGNQSAWKNGLRAFRFNDGYEIPADNFKNVGLRSNLKSAKSLNPVSKSREAPMSVRFAPNDELIETNLRVYLDDEISDSDSRSTVSD